MNRVAISIVIPCHNASATLSEAIGSALESGPIETEVVVVDDGSTDGSLNIAQKFGRRIRVLSGSNEGASAARNRGIAEATGEWLIFLDADDLLLSRSLKSRLDTAELTGADAIICDWRELIETDDGWKDGPIRTVDHAAIDLNAEIAFATHAWATTAAIMYRRSLVMKIGGFRHDLPIIQDARFLFDAAYHGARFAHSPHLGARYRVSKRSLSRRDPGRFWRDVLTNGKQIEALWCARTHLSPKHRQALAGIYNNAARGLFAARSPLYFEAVDCQRKLGGNLPLHSRIAAPLAQAVGLWSAQQILACLGRR